MSREQLWVLVRGRPLRVEMVDLLARRRTTRPSHGVESLPTLHCCRSCCGRAGKGRLAVAPIPHSGECSDPMTQAQPLRSVLRSPEL